MDDNYLFKEATADDNYLFKETTTETDDNHLSKEANTQSSSTGQFNPRKRGRMYDLAQSWFTMHQYLDAVEAREGDEARIRQLEADMRRLQQQYEQTKRDLENNRKQSDSLLAKVLSLDTIWIFEKEDVDCLEKLRRVGFTGGVETAMDEYFDDLAEFLDGKGIKYKWVS